MNDCKRERLPRHTKVKVVLGKQRRLRDGKSREYSVDSLKASLTLIFKGNSPSTLPKPLNECPTSPVSPGPSSEQRVDSGVVTSPVSDAPPAPTHHHNYAPLESRYYIYPPLITGHGRLVGARQAVPSWMGALVVVGGFACMVGCAIYV
jgi:hypothetical protein